jgi:4-hydroxybenzoate polyprenyltransferase
MFKILYSVVKTARPRQWIKNLALYGALIFSGFLFYQPIDGPSYFLTVTKAVIIFSFLTSSVYTLNDIIDIKHDKLHPIKKKRPIASGDLPIPLALFFVMIFLGIVFLFSLSLPIFFKILVLLYFILQLIYAKKTKEYAIFDVISIAIGFLIRVYAGAVVVNLHMSVWFLLTVVSASLFLAVGKRQSERTLIKKMEQNIGPTRVALKKYSQRLLDQYTGMFANATWLSYALFTFQHNISAHVLPANERFPDLYIKLPRTLQSEKLLMLTLPFVIFGVMRYLQLIYEEDKGETPELILLRDKTLLSTVFVWGFLVLLIIYL